jgi:hypothetical protein
MMKVREIKFEQFSYRNKTQGMRLWGRFSPGVFKNESGNGFGIRILKGFSCCTSGGGSISYEYFELDKTGLITGSPRGLAKQFDGKVRITDVAKIAKQRQETALSPSGA